MRRVTWAALALAAGLGACSSGMEPGALLAGGRDTAKEAEGLQRYAVVAVCPEVQVRDGTQMLQIFEKGKQDDLTAIRFQATINKFARECRTDGIGNTTIKVGTTGRLLAGPNGATGSVNLPLRVVLVRNGDEVLYSQIQTVAATIAPGTAATDWVSIVDGITVPADKSAGRFVIYVGFDESGQKRA